MRRKETLLFHICATAISVALVVSLILPTKNCVEAASKASQLDFEGNTTDPFGWSVVGWGDGQTVLQCQGISYVSGHTGLAARTSHNADDGCNDLTINGSSYLDTFFASSEVYYSYWIKFEPEYYTGINDVAATSNIKQIWELGSSNGHGHQEGAFSFSKNTLPGNIHFFWQWSGEGTGFDAGTDGTKYSGAMPYNLGEWAHVEFYMKLSSGDTHMNPDGIAWFRFNEVTYISSANVITGEMGRVSVPGIKAIGGNPLIGDLPTGQGWWQIDDYEVWDGLPDTTNDLTPPAVPGGLVVR